MDYQKKSYLLIFMILSSSYVVVSYIVCAEDAIMGTVTYVYDGDTFLVKMDNGEFMKVRLLGIDTPECYSDNEHFKWPEINNEYILKKWAWRAKEYVSSMVVNKNVKIIYDESTEKKDKYGRELAYVIIDGQCINELLINKGFARTYTSSECEMTSYYMESENDAKALGYGIWSELNTLPYECKIVFVHYDASGNDNYNLNDEYIIIGNESSHSYDLSGCTISNSKGRQYLFPDGSSISAYNQIIVNTGKGNDHDSLYYIGNTFPMWGNEGDIVTIYGADGEYIDSYYYGSSWLNDQ